MKASKYNYVIPFGEKTIFFNGITEKFFMVPSEHAESYDTILLNPDENNEHFTSFFDRMKCQGFVIQDDVDEMQLIKEKYQRETKPSQYYLMVLPTYECNLRCWYCFQEHENIFMDDAVVEKIKKLIQRKLEDPEIKHFHLSWFGGEPLLAYDIVRNLTVWAKAYSESKNKRFTSAITTNGTLLNPKRIEELREAGIVSYQITIDGDREMHNSVKRLGEISAYDRTLSNVDLIGRHTHVTLRFNYTHDNLHPEEIIRSLDSVLSRDARKNINFTMFKVWQENRNNVDTRMVDSLFDLSDRSGLNPVMGTSGFCYAEQKHYDCIMPNGHVGKCDNMPAKRMPGILQPDGSIEWEQGSLKMYDPVIFDEDASPCYKCRYLPVCWGPCVAKRETAIRNSRKIDCMYSLPEENMTDNILNHCKNQLQSLR